MLYNVNNIGLKKIIQTRELLCFCLAVTTISYDSILFRDSRRIFLEYLSAFQYQLKITTEFLNKCRKQHVHCGIVLLFKSLAITYSEMQCMWARSTTTATMF